MNYEEALNKLPEYQKYIIKPFRDPKTELVYEVEDVIIAPASDTFYTPFILLRRDYGYVMAINQFKKEKMQIVGLFGTDESFNIPRNYPIEMIIEFIQSQM